VAGFVVGDELVFVFFADAGFFGAAELNFVACFFEVFVFDEVFVLHSCADGGFVDDGGEVCAGEHWGASCEFGEFYIWAEFDFFGVDIEDFESAFDIGEGDGDLAVESAWADECWVEYIWAVCCGDDDDAVAGFEAVHFYEDGVECLFSFVVSTCGESAASAPTYGVDFVEEDDAGCGFFGLFEEVADAGCSYAYEHFYEV